MRGTSINRISTTAAVAALVALGTLIWAANALASTPPSIEGETVTSLGATDATLEFRVNGEGLPASWTVYLEAPPCQAANPGSCEEAGGEEIWNGGGGPSGETLTLDIAKVWRSLSPNTNYAYYVVASSEAGKKIGSKHEFHTDSGPAPSLLEASVTNISARDATLNMKVDPNGLSTSYEIMVSTPNCPFPNGACDSISVWFPNGEVEADSSVQCISLDLPNIGVRIWPEHPYRYRIWATNSVGTAEVWGGFTTPAEGAPPEHEGGICPVGENGGQASGPVLPIGQPADHASLVHRKKHRHKRHRYLRRHSPARSSLSA